MTKYDRQFLIENTRLTLAGDKFYTGPFNMTLPIRTNTPANLTYMYNATTALVSESGTGLKGIYGYTFHRNNPALQQALDDSNLVLQQAEDAMAASNIAIIMLPLFLNILPISFVSDIRTRKMLIYVISADFLNAAPLCFKGVELIYIGKRRAQSVVTRISSAIGGEVSETAAAEIWAADCTTDNRVHATGVAFVVLAVVVALLGAVGEVVGWIYAYRRGHLLAARANHRSDMLRDKNLFLGIQDRDFSLTDDIGFDTDAKDV